MRILANENIPRAAILMMREHGHDVLWVRESFPGMTDARILELAVSEQRIVVTFDKDFGELAFRSRLPAACGIILLRFRKQLPDQLALRIIESLGSRNDWVGRFSVVEEDRIRMTQLPSV